MVYESDFYTTRRPYRSTPSYSTYTVSSSPSRQVRILPGLGKVHVVHTYDRIVPYVGHKRLTVVTLPPKVYSTRQSVLQREYDWIENKVRPWVAYSPTNRYLNSASSVRIVYVRNPLSGLKYHSEYIPSRYYNFYRMYRPLSTYDDYDWPYYRPLSLYYNYWPSYMPSYRTLSYLDDVPIYRSLRLQRIFDDETRLIKAQTASLLKQIHLPVPRIRSWHIAPLNRYGVTSSLPVKYSNDTYIHRLLTVSPNSKIEYATYYTEPVKKYIGQGHLSCVSYAGDKGYNRRRPLAIYEDALKNDIQLLSYYITKFRQEKTQPKEIKVPLSASRPSRIFSVQKPLDDPVVQEIKDLREARAARLAKIYATDEKSASEVEDNLKAKKKKEEARLAEERAIAEEQARKAAQAKKEEAARKAELERQEQLAAQAAAERAAELERQAEKARQDELAKQAEIAKARQLEEEKARQEEQRRLEEEAKAEEERKQLLRLEEIARQAEEEKEAELARQAEELAELARQEAERAELERQEREQKEKEQKEAELAELARQEAELAELERQEKELAELAKQEAELASKTAEETEVPAAEESVEESEVAETAKEEVAEPAAEEINDVTAEEVGESTPEETVAAEATDEPVVTEPETEELATNETAAEKEE
ncbi:uncharacterized protein CG45076-like isoform X1 [Tenebrio molitor]|uniref:uncharacterized protein CG45076-like isoform X1 n=1 Tax=Tenebrio molitor TaxID=7067 RepID=UPI003624989C